MSGLIKYVVVQEQEVYTAGHKLWLFILGMFLGYALTLLFATYQYRSICPYYTGAQLYAPYGWVLYPPPMWQRIEAHSHN